MDNMTSGLDLLIALLAVPGSTDEPGEAIHGITRLEKLVFLVLKEGDLEPSIDTPFNYKPYDYGPYSTQVLKEVETLNTVDLIKIEKVPFRSIKEVIDKEAAMFDMDDDREFERVLEIYRITQKGLRVWEGVVRDKFSKEEIETISRIKRQYNSMDLDQLLRTVYERFPKYTTESKIIKEIFGHGSRPDLTPFEREE